ncbi:MAG: D-2-hydroxyacid dehydrogenase [Actinobacteria bacterium]|nr:MAG: D-2-hydroxyacid dehydrogenase [Actinomycetota bacterium]
MSTAETSGSNDHVLFCTDTFAEQYRSRLAEISPGLEIIELSESGSVPDEDIERITLAFFSSDSWPERAPSFFKVLVAASGLQWLHSMSAGVDSPVFKMFLDRGARVTTSSGASSSPIAGTVMLYLLALSRGLPEWMRAKTAHEWSSVPYRELSGQQIAVVGYGPIGQEVVRLAVAFGMNPVVVRRAARGDEPCPVQPLSELRDVVAEADAVVCALPLLDDTRGVFSAEIIDAMGPETSFVNVGRGELVDQRALTEALASGRLGGAGLDVFDPEPLATDDPLWDLPNVIISPHVSGATNGTSERVVEIFLDNLGRFFKGDPMRNEVNA